MGTAGCSEGAIWDAAGGWCEPDELPFTPQMGVGMLLTLALLKTVTTELTISSGGSGGVFGPSRFLSAGCLAGRSVNYWPRLFRLELEPGRVRPGGDGGFFAGVSKTPLTSIMMVSEMAGNYSLLVPLDARLRLEHGTLEAMDAL